MIFRFPSFVSSLPFPKVAFSLRARLSLLLIFGVTLLAGIIWGIALPQYQYLVSLHENISFIKTTVEHPRPAVLEKVPSDLTQIQGLTESVRGLLPAHGDALRVVTTLESIASARGLVPHISISVPEDTLLGSYHVSFSTEGDFDTLRLLLHDIETGKYLLPIESITLAKAGRADVSSVVSPLSLSLSLRMYEQPQSEK